MKQLLCLILSVAMLIGCIAPVGYAAEISSDADVIAQSGDVAVEATNGIGSLLSAEISEVEEETSASELSSHVITDVMVENNIATVSYSAEDYATVVVAIYSEDGLRLLSSTSGEATPDDSEVELSFQGDMPEYFLVRAYMMDSVDCTPLSDMYETPIYTQSMQELLDSTIDDYDPDLVVNFDDDPTTNFAVYNEGVVIVDEVDGVNIVTTNDDENLLYVIENADEIFTSLQSGDIVSYFYGDDELLLCKVDTISVEDNCVTIHGSDNMELEELFSHIKLEMVMDNSDLVEIDDPDALVDSQSGTYAVASLPNGDSSIEVKPIHFDFYHQFPGAEDEGLNGYIDVLLDNTTDLYFADGKTHYQWELKYELSCNFKITVLDKEDKSLTVPVLKNFKLGSISAVGMVYDPQFVFTANCSVNVNTTIYGSSGINCATGRDPINITTPMKMDAQVDIEGNVFIGFDLKPAFYVLNKNVLKVDMSVPIGGHLNGSLTGNAFESTLHQSGPDLELHECDVCLKGEIYGSVSLEVSIKFFNSKKIELGGKVSKKFLSFPFYWSFTFGDIDWGSCPYKQYLVAFQVIDQEYAPVSNVTIHADDLSLHTDETGTAVGYFYAGSINVQVSYADLTESKRYNIDGPGRKIKIVLGEEDITFEDFIEGTIEDDVMDDTFLVAHGKCGDNLSWTLNSYGVLTISGSGEMYDYTNLTSGEADAYDGKGRTTAPWSPYAKSIYTLILESGVKSIGINAFAYFYNLTSVSLPDTLTTIKGSAFPFCLALQSIEIPDSVTTIESYAFSKCHLLKDVIISRGLTEIDYGVFFQCGLERVSIPENVNDIGGKAFAHCINLTEVDLPDGLLEIGDEAFYGCSNLAEITLPDGLTSIRYSAFRDCDSLTSVIVPDSVTSIGYNCFNSCSLLESVVLPNGLTEIESSMFGGCSNLTSVTIPDTVTEIGSSVFYNCSKLRNIAIPEGVVSIGSSAFYNCDIRSIVIPEGVTSLSSEVFGFCDYLTSIVIPDGLTKIDAKAFYYCSDLPCIYIPKGVTSIGRRAFYDCDSLQNIYYGGTETEWKAVAIYEDNDPLLSASIHYNSTQADVAAIDGTDSIFDSSNGYVSGDTEQKEVSPIPVTLAATYSGEYGGEDKGDYIQRTASFSGLMPGEEYVMLSLVSIYTDHPVAPENLLYIAQAEAGEDGNLSFTYVQRVTTDPSYVVLCGPATKTLADSQITVPEYYTDGELHVVNPDVVYDGETLQEGRDYEITGQVCFTEAGTYTCFIRGIHNYTGTMQCVYTVGEWNCDENGHDFEDGFCRYCDEEDPDAQPTEPTEPSDPTDPSEPIDPTEPTEPSDPSEPTEPAGEGVIRLSGANRYETGFAVADQLKKNLGVDQFEAVVVAYGQNFPDALTGSYLAAVKNAPILLTEKSVDHTVAAYIDENLVSGGTVYILGGAAAVSESFENALRSRGFAVKRLKGAGRYETNLAILKEAGVTTTDEVLIATGKNYADSLSASATGLPMLLVDKELSEAQKAFLETTSGKFVIIGGTGAVSADVEAELDAIGDVTRVKGANRYGTSVEIAKRYFTDPESAVLAYAQGFPDGLCGGPLALSMDAPLILTSNDSFAAADDYVTGISSGAVTGGTSRISDDTVRAIFDLSPDTPVVKP